MMNTEKYIKRSQVLDELDVRTNPDGSKRIFSIKFVTKEGKVVFFPQCYACGAGRMNNKEMRMRGIQPCDCKGNPELHVYPMCIDNMLMYNEKRVIYSEDEIKEAK